MDDNWPFIFKACAIFFSFAAALLLIWFTVDYWSRLIGWAVIAIDVTAVVAYFLGAGHTKPPEDPP